LARIGSLAASWAAASVLAALVASSARGEAGKPALEPVRELLANRRFAEAVDRCTRLIAADERLAEAYHLRGKARILEGREGTAAAALADFTAAIRYADRFPEAYFERGLLQLETGVAAAALADFEQAIRQGMTGRDVVFYRGMANLQTDHFGAAVADFTAALQLDPGMADAYLNRGVARYRLDRLKEAQTDLERAIQLDRHLARAYLNRGVVRLKRGDLDGAIGDFDQTLEQSHRSGDRSSIAPAYFDRGRAFYLKHDYARAIDDWEHLVRNLDDSDPMTRDCLGLAYVQLDNAARAVRYFEDAVRLDHTHVYAPAHAHLAAVRYNQHDFPAAIKECTIALEIDPKLVQALTTRSLAYRNLRQLDLARADQEQILRLQAQGILGTKMVEGPARSR
jgi:tetratricopeptide (TPR) repeat protein